MVDIELSEHQLRLMQLAIDRAWKQTRRTGQNSVLQAAKSISASARKHTQPTAWTGKRRVLPGKVTASGRKARGSKWVVEFYNRDGSTRLEYYDDNPPRSKEPGRSRNYGLASRSFVWWMKRLGMSTKLGSRASKATSAKKFTRVRKRLELFNPEIRLRNNFDYITDAYPALESEALRAGIAGFVGRFDKDFASRINAEWHR